MATCSNNPTEFPHPPQLQGILITAEHLERLSPDDAGRFVRLIQNSTSRIAGLEVVPIWHQDLTAEPEAIDPDAAPVTRPDFLSFARRHDLPEHRGAVTWLMAHWTAPHAYEAVKAPTDAYPAVVRLTDERIVHGDHHQVLDLRSMYHRLRASRLDPDAWRRGSQLKTEFLARLVNEVLQPDEPLPTTRREAVRTLPNTAELITEQMKLDQRERDAAVRREREQAEAQKQHPSPHLAGGWQPPAGGVIEQSYLDAVRFNAL